MSSFEVSSSQAGDDCLMDTDSDGFHDVSRDDLPTFKCKGFAGRRGNIWRDTCSDSYLQKGEIIWLFQQHKQVRAATSVVVFGCELSFSKCNLEDVTDLFSLIKMNITKFKCALEGPSDYCSSSTPDWLEIRKDISCVLNHLKHHFTVVADDNVELLISVIDEIGRLLICIGRLSDRGDAAVQDTLSTTSAGHHYFHLCLDVWWFAIEVAYLAKNNGLPLNSVNLAKDNKLGSLPSQLEKFLLADLIIISSRIHKRTVHSNDMSGSRFSCQCLQELFIMLRIFIDKTQEVGSFWKNFNVVLNMLKNEEVSSSHIRHFTLTQPDNVSLRDANLFTFWLVSGIAQIYNYDERGNFGHQTILSNYPAVNDSVKSILKDEEESKKKEVSQTLKDALLFAKLCCELWEPNLDLVLPLLEFFMKRLNKPDELSFGLDASHEVPSSGLVWRQRLTRWCSASDSGENEAFGSLISVFASSLRKLILDRNPQSLMQLQKLKGRLYSKIQPRRLDDLNEVGLFKFLTIFLTFAVVVEDFWSEITNKICEISKLVVQKNLDHPKSALVLKCLFSILQSAETTNSNKADCSKIIALISVISERLVTDACSLEVASHSPRYSCLVSNILVYLAEVNAFSGSLPPNSQMNSSTQNLLPQSSQTPEIIVKEELNTMLIKQMEKLIHCDAASMKKIEEILLIFFQDMRQAHGGTNWVATAAIPLFTRFVNTYMGQTSNVRLFRALEILVKLCPEVVRGAETIFCVVSKAISRIEAQRRIGSDEDLRRSLRELVRKCAKA